MKKIYSLFIFSMIMVTSIYSQKCFRENTIQTTTFNLTSGKSIILENSIEHRILIADEENDILKKKKRRGGRRNGSDFITLSYTRLGISFPKGTLSAFSNMGFFWQGMIEGLIQNKFGVGISFGYFIYPGRKVYDYFGNTVSVEPVFVTPLAATLKYFFLENEFKPYIGADLGVMFLSREGNNSETKFGGTPRAGFLLSFSEDYLIGIDVSTNILQNGNGLNLGLQFGYVFGN